MNKVFENIFDYIVNDHTDTIMGTVISFILKPAIIITILNVAFKIEFADILISLFYKLCITIVAVFYAIRTIISFIDDMKKRLDNKKPKTKSQNHKIKNEK